MRDHLAVHGKEEVMIPSLFMGIGAAMAIWGLTESWLLAIGGGFACFLIWLFTRKEMP